jgi:hypothetical protein
MPYGIKEINMTEQEWLECEDPQVMLEQFYWGPNPVGEITSTGFRRDRPHDRKLRLFACACVRQIQHLLPDKRNRDLIEVSELYADGLSSDEALEAAWRATNEYELTQRPYATLTHWVVPMMGNSLYQSVVQLLIDLRIVANVDYGLIQADLLRDIVGSPSRPVKHKGGCNVCEWAGKWRGSDPCVVCDGRGWVYRDGLAPEWLTPIVLSLASATYDLRERQCGRCDSGWLPKQGAPDPGMMSRCSSCHGTGRIEDGALDPVRLAVLADALEEAGCSLEEPLTLRRKDTDLLLDRQGQYTIRRCQDHPEFDGSYNPGGHHDHTSPDGTHWVQGNLVPHYKTCEGCWTVFNGTPSPMDLARMTSPNSLLEHLRSPGPHVRGCWAVDVVLGNS